MKLAKKDKCFYCGVEYHPQLVCTSATTPPSTIWVCILEFIHDDDGTIQDVKQTDKCRIKARSAGYTERWDLTPKR